MKDHTTAFYDLSKDLARTGVINDRPEAIYACFYEYLSSPDRPKRFWNLRKEHALPRIEALPLDDSATTFMCEVKTAYAQKSEELRAGRSFGDSCSVNQPYELVGSRPAFYPSCCTSPAPTSKAQLPPSSNTLPTPISTIPQNPLLWTIYDPAYFAARFSQSTDVMDIEDDPDSEWTFVPNDFLAVFAVEESADMMDTGDDLDIHWLDVPNWRRKPTVVPKRMLRVFAVETPGPSVDFHLSRGPGLVDGRLEADAENGNENIGPCQPRISTARLASRTGHRDKGDRELNTFLGEAAAGSFLALVRDKVREPPAGSVCPPKLAWTMRSAVQVSETKSLKKQGNKPDLKGFIGPKAAQDFLTLIQQPSTYSPEPSELLLKGIDSKSTAYHLGDASPLPASTTFMDLWSSRPSNATGPTSPCESSFHHIPGPHLPMSPPTSSPDEHANRPSLDNPGQTFAESYNGRPNTPPLDDPVDNPGETFARSYWKPDMDAWSKLVGVNGLPPPIPSRVFPVPRPESDTIGTASIYTTNFFAKEVRRGIKSAKSSIHYCCPFCTDEVWTNKIQDRLRAVHGAVAPNVNKAMVAWRQLEAVYLELRGRWPVNETDNMVHMGIYQVVLFVDKYKEDPWLPPGHGLEIVFCIVSIGFDDSSRTFQIDKCTPL